MSGLKTSTAAGVNVVIWCAAALACTYAANHKCDFIKIYDSSNGTTASDQFIYRGLWKGMWTTDGECTSYRTGGFVIDRHWNGSRYASVISDVLSGFALITSCVASIPRFQNKGILSAVASLTAKTCLFQGLTLLFLTSSACYSKTGLEDTVCEINQAGNLSIAATALWFMASLFSCCTSIIISMEDERTMDTTEEG